MNAICVADIHGDVDAISKLAKSMSVKDFDYVFLLGDYSRGFKDPAENKADIIFILETLKDFKVYAIPGNCDQKESVEMFKKKGVNLHNTVLETPEADIIGLGGSNPTPFKTPFELSEEEILKSLNGMHEQIQKGRKTILICHAPPHNTLCDMINQQTHVGSTAVRKFIEEKQPDLVLCSHIHESAGKKDTIGKTRIMNLGKISEGRAYELTLDAGLNIEFYTG